MAIQEVTRLLRQWQDGDQAALDTLTPLIYDELRSMARSAIRKERPDHTLGSTALAHEVFLNLLKQSRVRWKNRAHLFGVIAQLMRRVTIHHAERHRAAKRGAGAARVPLDESRVASQAREEDILALEESLARLEGRDARQARIVELRFFGGYSAEEISEVLEVSPSTIHREWRIARAWLRRDLEAPP